ncbi:MAG TPA: hypothetical protein VFR87_04405 [Nocardioidaceae bacterium]|nr:hypothetical protein [Nocardioidaceae bacterium]
MNHNVVPAAKSTREDRGRRDVFGRLAGLVGFEGLEDLEDFEDGAGPDRLADLLGLAGLVGWAGWVGLAGWVELGSTGSLDA